MKRGVGVGRGRPRTLRNPTMPPASQMRTDGPKSLHYPQYGRPVPIFRALRGRFLRISRVLRFRFQRRPIPIWGCILFPLSALLRDADQPSGLDAAVPKLRRAPQVRSVPPRCALEVFGRYSVPNHSPYRNWSTLSVDAGAVLSSVRGAGDRACLKSASSRSA